MRIGILDIGSNSAHLQVIDGYPGAQPLTVFRLKARTGLADAINPDGALDENAMPRLLRAVSDAANAARDQEVDELIVLATALLLIDPTHRRQAELISAATTRPDRAALAALAGG